MTHCVWTMLVAVLLQPPVAPAKPQPASELRVEGREYSLDFSIAAERLAVTHPDIRIAEARLMEAQAALDQAKRKVTLEAFMNQAKYDQAKADAAAKTKEFERLDAIHKSGQGNNGQHAQAAAELQTAKRQLTFAELLTQSTREAAQASNGVELHFNRFDDRAILARWVAIANVPPAQTQSLHDLLQRKVKLTVKATDADNSVIGVLERSIKEWDFAGAKVIVRYPQVSKAVIKDAPSLQPVDGDNTIGIWLLLMLDEFNNQTDSLSVPMRGKHQIYVREYGLLFTLVKNAPDGAPTLAEFLRQAKK